MPDTASITKYLKDVEQAVALGQSTEHTHRPAIKTLIEAMLPGITATNEPGRVACGAPDFAVSNSAHLVVGYVETKDIGKPLDEVERTDQLKRYRRSLSNLILTDYLEFRWYVDGEPRRTTRIAKLVNGELTRDKVGVQATTDLLGDFLAHQPSEVSSPRELAQRMARLAHIIRDIIIEAFRKDIASDLLRVWRGTFAEVLIAGLDRPENTGEFADMYAQTLAYGLFSARVMDTSPGFTRQEAQRLIPRTNPFLRDFFYQISGPQLEDEPYVSFVDDLTALLDHTDIDAVLKDFGKRTRQEDPVVHFYETFLAAYDPKLREVRGVFYTPEPAVSYIVRAVDYLLKKLFGCPAGLADSTKISVPNSDPGLTVKGKKEVRKTTEVHKVLILDPAAGTATFIYSIIDLIRQGFMQSGNAGMWSSYVRDHLLPRLFGFELLVAPYAVAHFKLGLQLAGYDLPEMQRQVWGYDFAGHERINIFLTNTLEGYHEWTGLPLLVQAIADETNAANRVKQALPIMVVLGNQPYSGHSANKGPWIDGLLKGRLPDGTLVPSYYEVDGQPLGEKNPKWLQDDYVKFIRWGQWRIERTGAGILAFITNNSYLDNPTFRGMRQALLNAFTDIYLLNLHGNSKKREVAPDGGKDENIFDIQQGVCIGIFVKQPGKNGPAKVHYADLWGLRSGKYHFLGTEGIDTTVWAEIAPQAPLYLFVPQQTDLLVEYQQGWKLTDAMPVSVLGYQTHRDQFAIAFDRVEMMSRMDDMRDEGISDADLRERYNLSDSNSWHLASARRQIRQDNAWQRHIVCCAYRPFDLRWCYFNTVATDRPRREFLDHVVGRPNFCLNTVRQTKAEFWRHALVADSPTPAVFLEIKDGSSSFPLYLYRDALKEQLPGLSAFEHEIGSSDRVPNLSPALIAKMEHAWQLRFIPNGRGDLQTTFGPEDVLGYFYAVLDSPTYQARYREFMKTDFPHIPITSDPQVFRDLAQMGLDLTALHLLDVKRAPQLQALITRYPISGSNLVEKGHPRYDEQHESVYISADDAKAKKQGQYFEGVSPEVWNFDIGGYQVLSKWLKDRQGRQLTYYDFTHYQQMVVAITETIRLMAEIDDAIPGWPIT